ncbi:non-ribosomal peptide synthetase [Actinopolymorpha pittospori]|uniref:Phenyloxazoline synthase MbtB n=1 Tax=Actinopolymorpha pittospori TaxID=648752 RepID=A0A927MV61_9ACTN|nr:non-ribosomal peptide synthetase [Actinopolymorpha pittospori]MBE1603895.1 amino acid adenylation domain-containing protein [Actinopolymorpha pittospori]
MHPTTSELDSHDVRHTVASVLELPVEGIGEDLNLIELGMDSMTMMRLAGQWQQAGVTVRFADLIARPTLAAWRELVARRHAGVEDAARDDRAGEAEEFAPFELTTMQHAYRVGRAPGQRLGGVAAHFYFEFDGAHVDPHRLEAAVRALIARHGMLRVQISDGYQQVLPNAGWLGLPVQDLRAMSTDQAEHALAALRRRMSTQEMEIGSGQVLDVRLSLLPEAIRIGGTRLHLDLDMIPADALSVQTLFSDLARLYEHPDAPLTTLDYSFPRYCADHRATRPVERVEADRDYWRARLADLPAAPQLPVRTDREAAPATQVVRRSHWLAPETVRQLRQLSRNHGLTPSMTLAAAFAETLTAWSAEPDFLLNLPLFDREPLHPRVDAVVGDFTSSVLVSWAGSTPGSFAERARRLQDQFHADVAHSRYSGVEVLRDASRLLGETVLAPVVYTSALGFGDLFAPQARGCFGEPAWIVSQGPQIWLDVQVSEFDQGILVNWDAREGVFAAGVLDALFEAYRAVVAWLGEGEWGRPVPDLLPDAQRRVRAAVNSTAREFPDVRLHEEFFRRAAEAPDRVALRWEEDGSLGYGEMADRALRVAGALASRRVEPGEPVVVSLPRGPDQIVAVLGVLAAGAAYLPIGPEQPAARRERMERLAGARLVITDEAGAIGRPAAEVVLIGAATTAAPLPCPAAVDAEGLAYVIFTSGSTGEPKGVEITHRSAWNTIADINRRFAVSDSDRVLAVSALEFDLSVYDVFGPLSVGGAVVLVTDAARRDARRWVDLAQRHGVTVWNSVPVLLEMLLTVIEGDASARLPLRLVLVSGDWVGLDLPGRVAAARPQCRFVALGGATEAAIWSNFTEVARVDPLWSSVPYGRPLANQRFRVVDTAGRDCPDWVPGELWIGGTGVARGYRGAPQQTDRQFISTEAGRWYRTGDLGRYRPEGVLEFLGRTDQQVKIAGHRIELGEIEAVLQSHPGVGRAVAAVTDHRQLVVTVVETGTAGAAQESHSAQIAACTVDAAAVEVSMVDDAAAASSTPPAGSIEAEEVDALLVRILGLETLTGGRRETVTELTNRLGVAEQHRPVLRLWLRWLRSRAVLSGDGGTLGAGPRLDPALRLATRPGAEGDAGFVARVRDRVLHRREDYRRVLAGDLDPAVLLDDDLLAPSALADHDPSGHTALAEVAREIAARSAAEKRPIEVVEIGGRAGHAAERILSSLTPEQVRYTLLDQSPAMVADARRRLATHPHATKCRATPNPWAPGDLRHRFDVVVAVNALHRYPEPTQGLMLARLLARRGGRLLAVEQGEFPPLALLTAALLEYGYRDLDGERRAAGSPTLSAREWGTVCGRAGWRGITHHRVGASSTVLLSGARPETAPDIDPAALLDHAASALPQHMVPDRIEVVAWLPLGRNGKVDRAALTRSLATDRSPELAEPPQGPLEEAVAAVWTDLLSHVRVGRNQNFFAIGGDSLLATRLLERLRHRFGGTLSLRDFFAEPTVSAVARQIAGDDADIDEGAL